MTLDNLNTVQKCFLLSPLRLLVIGARSKLFHLEEFCNALSKFNIESKLISDEDFLSKFYDLRFYNKLKTKKRFEKLLNEFKPDLVFLDRQTELGLKIINAKIPMVVTIRGDYWKELELSKQTLHKSPIKKIAIWRRQKIIEKCFKNAKIIFPISMYLKAIVEKHYSGTIEVLYNSRNPNDWYDVKGMKLKHPCVGLLQGAGIWGKTEEMLILTKVIEALPNVTFYWGGDGVYRDNILSSLKKYENFKWLGNLEYPGKVREFLSEIDIYALVSGMDTLGQTILEASLMKKTVIATNVGGIPEVLKNGNTGYLVEKGDHEGWIEKISVLLNDKERAKRMGIEGHKFICENFTWEKTAERFISIIKEYKILHN